MSQKEAVFDLGEEAFSSDHFRMYEFKVKRCPRARPHDWTQCPFAHPGEKARRRDARKYRYSGTACPEYRKNGACRRGDACPFAHGVFECWLHPSRYKTQLCTDGTNCKRRVCFFAHEESEIRKVEEDPILLQQQLQIELMSMGDDSLSRQAGVSQALQALLAAQNNGQSQQHNEVLKLLMASTNPLSNTPAALPAHTAAVSPLNFLSNDAHPHTTPARNGAYRGSLDMTDPNQVALRTLMGLMSQQASNPKNNAQQVLSMLSPDNMPASPSSVLSSLSALYSIQGGDNASKQGGPVQNLVHQPANGFNGAAGQLGGNGAGFSQQQILMLQQLISQQQQQQQVQQVAQLPFNNASMGNGLNSNMGVELLAQLLRSQSAAQPPQAPSPNSDQILSTLQELAQFNSVGYNQLNGMNKVMAQQRNSIDNSVLHTPNKDVVSMSMGCLTSTPAATSAPPVHFLSSLYGHNVPANLTQALGCGVGQSQGLPVVIEEPDAKVALPRDPLGFSEEQRKSLVVQLGGDEQILRELQQSQGMNRTASFDKILKELPRSLSQLKLEDLPAQAQTQAPNLQVAYSRA